MDDKSVKDLEVVLF